MYVHGATALALLRTIAEARSSMSLAENNSNVWNVYSPGRLRALQCLRADVRCALDAAFHPE